MSAICRATAPPATVLATTSIASVCVARSPAWAERVPGATDHTHELGLAPSAPSVGAGRRTAALPTTAAPRGRRRQRCDPVREARALPMGTSDASARWVPYLAATISSTTMTPTFSSAGAAAPRANRRWAYRTRGRRSRRRRTGRPGGRSAGRASGPAPPARPRDVPVACCIASINAGRPQHGQRATGRAIIASDPQKAAAHPAAVSGRPASIVPHQHRNEQGGDQRAGEEAVPDQVRQRVGDLEGVAEVRRPEHRADRQDPHHPGDAARGRCPPRRAWSRAPSRRLSGRDWIARSRRRGTASSRGEDLPPRRSSTSLGRQDRRHRAQQDHQVEQQALPSDVLRRPAAAPRAS